jgi:hypothetical protein
VERKKSSFRREPRRLSVNCHSPRSYPTRDTMFHVEHAGWLLKALNLPSAAIGPRGTQNRAPKKLGLSPKLKSSQRIAADPLLAAPCGAVGSLAAPRALVCSAWNANKSLAENAGPELFHVERVHGHKPLQVALICFTWNVTESLTAAANPCLVPRGTPAVLS